MVIFMIEEKEVTITTEYIKLDQFLKFTGAADTGGHAKEIIEEAVVFVNGEVCTMRGKKLRDGDIVKLDDYIFKVKNKTV